MIAALLLSAVLVTPPDYKWQLTGLYTFTAGLDEVAGAYARSRNPSVVEGNRVREFDGRLSLKLVIGTVYVATTDYMLTHRWRPFRIAGQVLRFGLPAVYLYGAMHNLRLARRR